LPGRRDHGGGLEAQAQPPEAGTPIQVLQHRVGPRPGRPSVRLEAEQVGAHRVIHDYGHGGAGVTLSWGCAEEVVRLVGPAS
jgi:D-amino-acid oxidase